MRDELLYYYERELGYLRQMGAEFAEKYPKIASRLVLEKTKCEDPHVERLLEGFAFLAARVHLKINDELPEITEALLQTLYPHYIRPIPSISLVQFQLDPEQGKLTTGFKIPRNAHLYSRPVNGQPCKFQTCAETTVWPLNITLAEWKTPERFHPPVRGGEAIAALRLEFRGFSDVKFEKLDLNTLRIFLGQESGVASALYELLLNNCRQIIVRDPTPNTKHKPITLPGSAIQPASFTEEESILPYPRRSFDPYRIIQEYFSFPQKFLSLDLGGFDQLRAHRWGDRAEFIFLISPFERSERQQMLENIIHADGFKLACTPVVNLFSLTSEPILLNQRQHEYLVIADARRQETTEIFSVNEVVGVSPMSRDTIQIDPFYAFRHSPDRPHTHSFWQMSRRPAGWRSDGGTEVYLSFVDIASRPLCPEMDAITVRLTCFNRDLPSRLPFGNINGDFDLEGGGPVRRITALVKPTSTIYPPLGSALNWRLISQLSLNYLSIADGGAEALRQVLRLQNLSEASWLEKQIQGIVNVSSKPAYSQIASDHGMSFARGRKVEILFDEEQYAGGGVYLFASILERFVALYASMNSFTILSAHSTQRREGIRQWPPRAGNKVLI